MKEYLNYLKQTGKSYRTIETYRQALSYYQNFIKKYGTFDIRSFTQYLYNKNLNPRTFNLYLQIIRRYLKWKEGRDLEISDYKMKVPKLLPKPIPEDLFKKILKEVKDPQVKMSFIFGYFAGLRLEEVLNLSWSDIILPEGENEPLQIRVKGKGSKERITFLIDPEWTKEIIKLARKHKKGKIFKISRIKIQREVIRISRKIGIHFTFHSFRHSFATNCLKIMKVEEVQQLLGHSSILTTLIYTKVNQKEIQEKIKRNIFLNKFSKNEGSGNSRLKDPGSGMSMR